VKKWEAPKLIVIVRSRPEESLILGCKNGDSDGANWTYTHCWIEATETCVLCQDWIGS